MIPQLFEMEQTLGKKTWDDMAMSCSSDETQIIRWIMLLHNDGKPFDLDPCYSTGRFWTGLPEPRLKFDIEPQSSDCQQADVRNLPLDTGSAPSAMFDPPFVVGSSDKPGIIRDRFMCYKSIEELWQFYDEALLELFRVLSKTGVLVVKCQDTVSGGKQHLSHVHIINTTEQNGWYCDDLFVLYRNNVLFSPNMANQHHARKNHCYFLVFKRK